MRGVDFVYADDFYRLLAAVAAQQGYGCAEKDLVGGLARFRINDLRRLQTLGEKADAAVDFAHPAFAVKIIAVFAAVAVGSRPVHNLHDFGPFFIDQLVQLVFQAAPACGRNVVRSVAHSKGRLKKSGILARKAAEKPQAQPAAATFQTAALL